ncbi:MAG TPA: hypothetical protein VMU89_24315 [Thermomicrobiaceae bacterium]|nr:hypothetical protein [Thermomicrobiaceae bacterium]
MQADGVVRLPGGLVLDDGQRIELAELRPLSGREEDWLATHPGVPSAVATTHLLGSCVVRLGDTKTGPELARRLLVGDRDYLMLQLRRLTLGERVSAVVGCPACGERMDVDFRVDDVPVEWRPQVATNHLVTMDAPAAGDAVPPRTVRVRLPNGADQEAVLGLEASIAVERLLARCLVEPDAALTAKERVAVIEALDRLAPQVEVELDLTCPECAHELVVPFDTTAFFLDEVRQSNAHLLREVHTLAFHYHWSETEILELTRARRRAYLSLLSDALRRD